MESVQHPGREVEKQQEAIRLALALAGEALQLGLDTTQMTLARGLLNVTSNDQCHLFSISQGWRIIVTKVVVDRPSLAR